LHNQQVQHKLHITTFQHSFCGAQLLDKTLKELKKSVISGLLSQ